MAVPGRSSRKGGSVSHKIRGAQRLLTVAAVLSVFALYVLRILPAWRNPAVRQLYGGIDTPNFFMILKNNWQTMPGIYLLQVFRAILYFASVLPLVRILRGPRWEVVLAISAFLAV